MITVLTGGGRSFKGAALYYLHDKREEGEAVRTSADRVAWTEPVNLPTKDPHRAWRMMTHTAMSQAAIKEAAGVKAAGRKLTKPVEAYSLSWHPDEKPTREQQMEAARATLAALDLEGYQALVVAHRDEPHAHVHILVNRVHPHTGVAANLSNSKLKLSEWAMRYEQERGRVFCKERVANMERRAQGEKVQAPRKARAVFEEEKAVGNDNLGGEFRKTQERQKDARLYARGREMEAGHRREWADLNRTYSRMKDQRETTAQRFRDARTAEIESFARLRWRHLYERQQTERETFAAAERGFLSKLWSMAVVWQAIRQDKERAEPLTIFYCLVSAHERAAIIERKQANERKDLGRQIKREIEVARGKVDQGAAVDLGKMRDHFMKESDRLREAQAGQQVEHKAAWAARNAERKQGRQQVRARPPRQQVNDAKGNATREQANRGRTQRDRRFEP